MTAAAFNKFSKLPKVVRLRIWRYSLSRPVVWAPIWQTNLDDLPMCTDPDADDDPPDAIYPVVKSKHLSPSPFLVGGTCREARDVMKESYIFLRPEQKRKRLDATSPGGIWVDPEQTIVLVGDRFDAVMHYFRAQDIAKFKHHVHAWPRRGLGGGQGLYLLNQKCSNMRSIFFRLHEDMLAPTGRILDPDTRETMTALSELRTLTEAQAAKYFAIATQPDLLEDGDDPFAKEVKKQFRRVYKAGPRPRVYFLDVHGNQQDPYTWWAVKEVEEPLTDEDLAEAAEADHCYEMLERFELLGIGRAP